MCTDSVLVTVASPLTVSAGDDHEICIGDSVKITATNGLSIINDLVITGVIDGLALSGSTPKQTNYFHCQLLQTLANME